MESIEQQKIINEEIEKRTGKLVLSGVPIIEILDIHRRDIFSQIAQMTWLKSLELRGDAGDIINEKFLNTTDSLTSSALEKGLKPLKDLENLTLNYFYFSRITVVSHLSRLRLLNLSFSTINKIEGLENLKELTELYLRETQISKIEGLENLKKLVWLDLGVNQISKIEGLENLKVLRSLNLEKNQITKIGGVENLKELNQLILDGNQITKIEGLENLKKLTILILSLNKISKIEGMENLQELVTLDLSKNSIIKVEGLESLNRLLTLVIDIKLFFTLKWFKAVADLNIASLTYQKNTSTPLQKQKKYDTVWLKSSGNMFPPEPIIEQGTDAIISYYKSLKRGSQPLNEVKILLVGDGAAGKTSLVKALLEKEFNEKESQTHGIQIQDSTITIEGEEITVHFWDFGGQEVMHATHQFFLTKDCVYVLVLDGRRDERPDYWLKHIDTFGKGAPVLVVLNKFEDNRSYDVVKQDLNSKYPNIQGYYFVSCKTKDGINEFKKALYGQLYDLPFRKTPFNFNWSSIKDHLREMEEPFITYDVYYKICKKFSITDKNEQETLLNYLNALGIVLHFEVLKAFNTQVLNPLWLTQAVYRVINSSIISGNKGVFAEKELFAILNDEKYKEIENAEDNNLFEKLIKWFARNKTNKRSRIIDYKNKSTLPFIAKVMQQFELSYSLDENRYIIPDLLPVEPSHPINYKEYDLHIAVDFYFLPPALMPRFMVQTHQHIKDAIRWRTGVMLNAESNYDATGVVSIDKDSKRLHIYVKGNQKRELLTYTRSVLKGLYNSYEGLKEPGRVVEKLFLPERPDIEVKLSEIEGLEEMGEKEYSNGIAQKKFNISSLLGGIQNPDYVINKDEKALKVFISYSRSKSKFREELVTMIHPLVNFKNNFLEAWHDEEILPGEDWKKEIDKALMKSDLVICLISAEYLKSEWCMYELQRANELNKIIYAILINHCGWEDHKTLKAKNGYYRAIEPIAKAQRPKNWMEIYQEINKLVTKNK